MSPVARGAGPALGRTPPTPRTQGRDLGVYAELSGVFREETGAEVEGPQSPGLTVALPSLPSDSVRAAAVTSPSNARHVPPWREGGRPRKTRRPGPGARLGPQGRAPAVEGSGPAPAPAATGPGPGQRPGTNGPPPERRHSTRHLAGPTDPVLNAHQSPAPLPSVRALRCDFLPEPDTEAPAPPPSNPDRMADLWRSAVDLAPPTTPSALRAHLETPLEKWERTAGEPLQAHDPKRPVIIAIPFQFRNLRPGTHTRFVTREVAQPRLAVQSPTHRQDRHNPVLLPQTNLLAAKAMRHVRPVPDILVQWAQQPYSPTKGSNLDPRTPTSASTLVSFKAGAPSLTFPRATGGPWAPSPHSTGSATAPKSSGPPRSAHRSPQRRGA